MNFKQYVTLGYGKVVCLPILPLTKELITIEKQSPKLAGYVNKRIQSLGLKKNI